MTKAEAIAIVRAEYPLAIAVPVPSMGMMMLYFDPLDPRGNNFGLGGPKATMADLWITAADTIRKGAMF
jgi:hypothetical protein